MSASSRNFRGMVTVWFLMGLVMVPVGMGMLLTIDSQPSVENVTSDDDATIEYSVENSESDTSTNTDAVPVKKEYESLSSDEQQLVSDTIQYQSVTLETSSGLPDTEKHVVMKNNESFVFDASVDSYDNNQGGHPPDGFIISMIGLAFGSLYPFLRIEGII